ncbi:MAG TPA: PLP-dependent aminotransferase family protein [Pseudonocardiaceae bacterium]
MAAMLGEWPQGRRPTAAALAAAVRRLVLAGRLPAGTRVPAERELAGALGASRTLVTAAFDRLRDEGLLVSRRGSGSWITLPGTASAGLEPLSPPMPGEMDLVRAATPAPLAVASAIDTARLRLPELLGGTGYHLQGLTVLRERIAARFTARGLPTTPDQILVTSGAQHAFVLVLHLLAGPGDRVLVEHPTYPNALEAVRAHHAHPVPVAMADEGWDLDALEATLRQTAPRLAYLIPDFQNPTGLRLDAEGRERLAAALRRSRTPAVIDETLVELDLEGDPLDGPSPVAAFAEDLVITVGSASKMFWGGLRVGWVRAPAELVRRLLAVRPGVDLGTPSLEQLVVAELLADPEADLQWQRERHREQRDVLVAALREHCPQWRFRVPRGGLVLWCELDAPVSTRLAVTAEGLGVRVAPGSRFGVHQGLEGYLRLPYVLPPEQLREAARRLGAAAALVGDSASDLAREPLQVT